LARIAGVERHRTCRADCFMLEAQPDVERVAAAEALALLMGRQELLEPSAQGTSENEDAAQAIDSDPR
jgi:hypothetical protein